MGGAYIHTTFKEEIKLNHTNEIGDWMADGCGAGIPGEQLDDFLHHIQLPRNKVGAFVGRNDLLQEGIQRLYESHTHSYCTI